MRNDPALFVQPALDWEERQNAARRIGVAVANTTQTVERSEWVKTEGEQVSPMMALVGIGATCAFIWCGVAWLIFGG